MKTYGLVVAGALLFSGAAANAAVIFSDDMTGSLGSLPSTSNWLSMYHTADTGNGAGSFGTLTADANDPGTNSQRLFTGTPGSSKRQAMLFTDTTKFDAAVTASQAIGDYTASSWSFTYWMRNDNAPDVRFAVKVDSTWYVRNAASTDLGAFDTDPGAGVTLWNKFEVVDPFGTSGWTPVAVTPTSSLERLAFPLTGAVTLPSTGLLTGVGVWATKESNYGLRLDLFEVSADLAPEEPAIPEPASLGLLGLGAAGLLLRRRK